MGTESRTAVWGGFFEGWSTRRKLGFGLSLVAVVGLVLALAWWSQRVPKAVLFSDLAERDAAVLTAELDKLKQAYSLSEDGRSILVAADTVHRTRLALMGKPLPLHGAVGFELFNNADFGVSDFVQKVNYQRALQGELTRTILAIDQVQDARIHLALPDPTLFRKDGPKAKASVSVSLKGGQSLRMDQVVGIQRLIAASVPEIKPEDVTVLDQHGVVLSHAGGEDAGLASGQLDARQGLEAHLTKKAARLLDQMFQPGESMVAVDVVLNHEQSRITTEEALGAAGGQSGHPAGVIARERTVTREPAGDTSVNGGVVSAQVQTQETDYQTGRRVAQVVSQGGQISHLNVAVVVKRNLGESELARVRQLVAAAVGLQPARGDMVTVHSIADLGALGLPVGPAASQAALPSRELAVQPVHPGGPSGEGGTGAVARVLIAMIGLALLVMGALWWTRRRPPAREAPALSEREREALLVSIKQWLGPQS
ncbi:flagellar M-ring protein FliF [Pelomonas saccharophila]|uniref:Flagellar M-ring protein n=1 Tax=Roseateles saccharophilus TaxID=304 RepID=A0ABU1YH90_ROSSA|nr:flagellar basal-body MS-ring/collar protein FliF [Roseateles saccharophilus]MDR7268217.1 flagellar M-ring protein FliF [Roseateles saccharophilus]